ncbi:hypothetical protein [uncultured Oscillibacter sp.]|uniref:hypothetical protein n=1 Tax=uncultured Oscillibacter sp. TaxID=876091 RepID=UPI0025FBB854|nr:hypothetical protein [uncultured Oscillibacter sp.]
MRLPQISQDIGKTRREIVTLRGINYSDQTQDGDLLDSVNLSARRFPYITTRRARQKQKRAAGADYSGGTALTAWGKLVAVEGTDLLYDGTVVGTVTAGAKQFAVVNTKMVIWPDKVYLDMKTRTVKPLGAKQTGSGAVFTASTMKVTGWGNLTQKFSAGDAVTISGCTTQTANNKDIVIKSLTADTITAADNTFTAATEKSAAIQIERKIPDMDFICESENRLWGCSSEAQTIYASSLGDPTNFNVFQGLSTDSYALAVGTEGSFTGCCKLTSSVLFWKETKLHKMLGGYPAEYSLYTYDIEGLQAGCHKSLQVINEVLFYMGLHGVYAYSGGTPSLISASFGERRFTDAVGGSDGDTYYLSVRNGTEHHLFVYETQARIWLREDDTAAVDFARIGKDLYFMDGGGAVWLADSGGDDPGMEWMAQFTPFYETAEGRKAYSRLLLRVELPRGSYLIAQTRCDGQIWRESGKIVGRDAAVIPLPIPVNRCDKFEIRLRGKGPCTILSVLREFRVGSDV